MPQRTMAKINESLDRFVKREMNKSSTPGVAVGILHRGRRYTNGYGITNVDHPLPVDADTFFQIGSTTKTFTGTAIMQLVEQGKVDLDSRVRRYLPDLKLRDPEATRNVTVRHLLTHMGGWLGDYFENTGWGDDALTRVVASMARLKQLTPLGTVWSYNNAGFYVAGRVIEKITKKPYEQAITEMLLEPLEMTDSLFFPEHVMLNRFVVGHITVGKKSTVARPWRLTRSSAPAGAIVSTANDQLKWAAFNMGDGRAPKGKRLLRKSTLQSMQKEQFHVGNMAEHMGLSWMINYVDGVKIVRHGGTTNGQLSAFLMVPEKGFAVTSLTNSTAGRSVNRAVVAWALENYLGLSDEAAPPIDVDRSALDEYAGKYRVEAAPGMMVEVSPRRGGLALIFPTPPATNNQRPPRIPALPFHFYSPDRFVISSGPYSGTRSDFVRSPSGKVAWLRFGGRLYRRLTDAQAKKLAAAAKKRK